LNWKIIHLRLIFKFSIIKHCRGQILFTCDVGIKNKNIAQSRMVTGFFYVCDALHGIFLAAYYFFSGVEYWLS
jgi:hypothetical protein